MSWRQFFDCRGFTLVELLVALVVTSVVLTAVATLAFAMGVACEITDDTSQKQAQLRYVQLRISELIRHSKLICEVSSDDFALWRADDNDDGQINIGELVYIEAGPNKDHLQLCEFPSSDGSAIDLNTIGPVATDWWSTYSSKINYIMLIPNCSNVEFGFDVSPPNTRLVSISFNLMENEAVHQYQISACLRSWAGNLLNEAADALVSDDD